MNYLLLLSKVTTKEFLQKQFGVLVADSNDNKRSIDVFEKKNHQSLIFGSGVFDGS